ncbi:class I SAM-dependent methyltransferase [Leisingera sp. ANG-Vp]|uniref:class I SAM-dependent methyltransferase n=1 Tax=Leisingera sp. ANG-Vp TaxID=1577896 RepID=UPI00058088F6|nr:class I SAM-dependent methyltransferase [Leisingera sp. ANG-Vp]KIC22614.1 dihydrolipoamide dehydrogenase [Leisingera sp. ANG-Vp]
MPSLNRIVMAKASRAMVRRLGPDQLDAAEISGNWGEQFKFRSYQKFRFPEYDVCQGPFTGPGGKPLKFDLILANQVWEHLDRPYQATKNIRKMLRKGGHFWLAVPFYIPFHAAPADCSRWSARGLKNLLIESGFAEAAIQCGQWGNRQAALRNMELPWPPEYDETRDSLADDPEMPICAWAMAQKI